MLAIALFRERRKIYATAVDEIGGLLSAPAVHAHIECASGEEKWIVRIAPLALQVLEKRGFPHQAIRGILHGPRHASFFEDDYSFGHELVENISEAHPFSVRSMEIVEAIWKSLRTQGLWIYATPPNLSRLCNLKERFCYRFEN